MINRVECGAVKNPMTRSIDLYLYSGKSVADQIVFSEANEGIHHEPTLRLKYGEAQNIMDELWSCGLRPTEGSGSAGSLKATENHLSDMRKIAFEVLEIATN